MLLDCEKEIAASYRYHRPVAGQFTVAHPYQAAPTLDSTTVRDVEGIREHHEVYGPWSSIQTASAQRHIGAAAEDAEHSLPHKLDVACSQQAGCAAHDMQPTQQRKRKRKQHIYQPNAQVAGIALASCYVPCVMPQLYSCCPGHPRW